MFKAKDQPAATQVGGRRTGYKGVTNNSGVEDNAYSMDAMQSGVGGTVLPRRDNDSGGIKGSKNPYGNIVPGVAYRADERGGERTEHYNPTVPCVKAELGVESKRPLSELFDTDGDPLPEEELEEEAPKKRKRRKQPEVLVEPEEEEYEDDDEEEYDEEETEDEDAEEEEEYEDPTEYLRQLHEAQEAAPVPAVYPAPDQSAALIASQTMVTSLQQKLSAVTPKKRKKKRVTLSGAFGGFKGRYEELIDSPTCICLMFGIDSDVFTPPASLTPFTISCGKENWQVYYAGQDIELPFLKLGMQIFFKTQEQ